VKIWIGGSAAAQMSTTLRFGAKDPIVPRPIPEIRRISLPARIVGGAGWAVEAVAVVELVAPVDAWPPHPPAITTAIIIDNRAHTGSRGPVLPVSSTTRSVCPLGRRYVITTEDVCAKLRSPAA
jgi:hypothetical protein